MFFNWYKIDIYAILISVYDYWVIYAIVECKMTMYIRPTHTKRIIPLPVQSNNVMQVRFFYVDVS